MLLSFLIFFIKANVVGTLNYIDCYLKTTELLDCVLIGICGVCMVIRSNTVCMVGNTCPKFWTSPNLLPVVSLKIARWVANRVDPDQMLHVAASDLGLPCLLRPVCWNTIFTLSIQTSQLLTILVIKFEQVQFTFCPFCWFKKNGCQFLVKECAQYQLTA